MVLGLRSKSKQISSVQVEYTVKVLEIKPWPASQPLKSIHSVVLQWETGDRKFGLTNPIIPSLTEGKIEINESFRLQVTLLKESSGRNNGYGSFQKNILQFHLHEPKKDKTVKGQLGTAVLDLAHHGIIKDSVRVGLPMNFKRSLRNIAQPVLYLNLQSVEKNGPESSSSESLTKEGAMDRDVKGSVLTLMSEEYAEEDEITLFTDEDDATSSSPINSHSFVENSADSSFKICPEEKSLSQNVSKTALKEDIKEGQAGGSLITKQESFLHDSFLLENDRSAQSSPVGSSIDLVCVEHDDLGLSKSHRMRSEVSPGISGIPTTHPLLSRHEGEELKMTFRRPTNENSKCDNHQEVQGNFISLQQEDILHKNRLKEEISAHEKKRNTSISNYHWRKLSHEQRAADTENNISDKISQESNCSMDEVPGSHIKPEESYNEENDTEKGAEHNEEDQSYHSYSSPEGFFAASVSSGEDARAVQQHEHLISDISIYNGNVLIEKSNGALSRDRRKNVSFSVRSPPCGLASIGLVNSIQCLEDVNEIGVLEDVSNSGVWTSSNKGEKDAINFLSRFDNRFSDKKVGELECRVKMLEGELREVAAMEMGLYSIVAEHGSSTHKVHTPARRLSRLYLYSSKLLSGERMVGAVRSVVSGLVIVAKACGNDVPRLTFWLSNSVLLRAIVSHAIGKSENPKYSFISMADASTGTVIKGKKFPLKWESISLPKEKLSFNKELNDWDDPQTFLSALEKVEAWIFTRIVESVWWQILAPYMQSSPKSFPQWKKRFERGSSLDGKIQNSCSFEIWKKAFQDACESLCPVRAEGHECGCLPMLAKQVMEQCVARLDVAMFNALLLESDDETSTDPVADFIINHMVLPVPPGKSSFGAGAQLKNAIGNWSRSLTDLFDMDVDDSSPDKNEYDERVDATDSFKSFHLLNALSDIFMLPKHMLLEKKVREEVCPAFSSSIIKRILSSFSPDEFCPDQVPASVFEALDSEDQLESSVDGMIRNLPCNASPISYSPPPVSSIQHIVGDIHSTSQLNRSGSSVTRKSHASDDELEELDSPFSAIILDKSSSLSLEEKEKTGGSFRYQLLRDVWNFDD